MHPNPIKTVVKLSQYFTMKNVIKIASCAFLVLCILSLPLYSQIVFYPKLKKYADGLYKGFGSIPEDRKETLRSLGDYVIEQRQLSKTAKIIIICTHNSRRSQMAQAWGMTASEYYGVSDVLFFSGGTESTAFNPRAADALKRAGFGYSKIDDGSTNPKYILTNKKSEAGWVMYSKKFSDSQNPQSDFAAVMVCSDADKSCPLVPGAEKRISLPFNDPKHYDNTPSEKMKYDEACLLIATEMFYTFDYVKKQLILKAEEQK